MILRRWVAAGVAGVAAALMLSGCASAEVQPSASAASSGSVLTPGPTLTKTQFANLVASGKLGSQSLTLLTFVDSEGGDPDNEGSENQEQSEAASCVKMNKLADAQLVSQAADDDAGAIVQTYKTAKIAAELFDLNQKCAVEQAELDDSTAVKVVDSGVEGSARWWLSKDPTGEYQATIAYGNLMAFVMMNNADKPTAFVASVAAQADEMAKG